MPTILQIKVYALPSPIIKTKKLRPGQFNNSPKATHRSVAEAGLNPGLPDSKAGLLLCHQEPPCEPEGPNPPGHQEERLLEPACPPPTGPCSVPLYWFGLNTWVLFPTSPEAGPGRKHHHGNPCFQGAAYDFWKKMIPRFPALSILWLCGTSLLGTAARSWLSGYASRLYISDAVSRIPGNMMCLLPDKREQGSPGVLFTLAPGCLVRGAGRAGAPTGLWGTCAVSHLRVTAPTCLVLKPGMTPLPFH